MRPVMTRAVPIILSCALGTPCYALLTLMGDPADKQAFVNMVQRAVGPGAEASLDTQNHVVIEGGNPAHPVVDAANSLTEVIVNLSNMNGTGNRIVLASYDTANPAVLWFSVEDFEKLPFHRNGGIATQQSLLARVLTTARWRADGLFVAFARTEGIEAEAMILADTYDGAPWQFVQSWNNDTLGVALVYNLDGTDQHRATVASLDPDRSVSRFDAAVASPLVASFIVNGCSLSFSGLCKVTPQSGETLVEPLAGGDELGPAEYLTMDPFGRVYATSPSEPVIYRLEENDGITHVYFDPDERLIGPQALALDVRNDLLYTTNRTSFLTRITFHAASSASFRGLAFWAALRAMRMARPLSVNT